MNSVLESWGRLLGVLHQSNCLSANSCSSRHFRSSGSIGPGQYSELGSDCSTSCRLEVAVQTRVIGALTGIFSQSSLFAGSISLQNGKSSGLIAILLLGCCRNGDCSTTTSQDGMQSVAFACFGGMGQGVVNRKVLIRGRHRRRHEKKSHQFKVSHG